MLAFLFFPLGLLMVVGPVESPAAAASGPFHRAALAPPDATLYLHVTGGRQVRAEMAERPIARWFHGKLARGDLGEAWRRLAEDADVSPAMLFDMAFGGDATLILRRGEAGREWAVLTEVCGKAAARLLGRLEAKILPPAGLAAPLLRMEVPGRDLVLARRDHVVLIGPRENAGLFNAIADRLGGGPGDDHEPSLAEAIDRDLLEELGDGQAGLFIRHREHRGGWSVAVASLDGDTVSLRHFGRFENPPSARGRTRSGIDPAPLDSFGELGLLAMIEPIDVGRSRTEAFLAATLGEGFFSRPMRRQFGQRRLIVVGEIESRAEADAVDINTPALALCVELRDCCGAERLMDKQIQRLLHRVEALTGVAVSSEAPSIETFEAGEPRQIDLGPLMEWVSATAKGPRRGAGLWRSAIGPGLSDLSLNWHVARDGSTSWLLIASHPQHLRNVAAALRHVDPPRCAETKPWQNCGVADGPRISRHLRRWADRAAVVAPENDPEEVHWTINSLADFAAGVERCTWRLSRPKANEIRINMEMRLTPEQER